MTVSPASTPVQRRRTAPRSTTHSKLINLRQASDETGVPYTSLYDLVARGILPSVRFPGIDRIWIKRADLDQLIERSVERRQS